MYIIDISIIIVLFVFLSNTTVTIKPFSIKCPHWISAVIALITMFGLLFYIEYKEHKSYEKGFKDGAEYVVGLLEKNRKEKK